MRVIALLIAMLTLAICYPFALVLWERWKAERSYIDGRQLVFTGSAWELFRNWIKWLLLSIVTLGIYMLWVWPRIQKWKWEHTDLASADPDRIPPPWPAPSQG